MDYSRQRRKQARQKPSTLIFRSKAWQPGKRLAAGAQSTRLIKSERF
jgi:hypothetical protein